LGGAAIWWQILLDPESRQLDARLNEQAAAAVRASTAWTKREPQRAEAWFYLAGAHAPLAQWRVLRGERLAAARDAKKIKDALERALALDPGLDDAHFGIGAYHYYAAVAPTTAKILRWLLFLPGGDRVRGLQEMLQARQRGVLLRGEADYQLHLILLWYEQKPAEALEILAGLDARYPTNPLFQRRIAEVQDEYFHDRRASEAAWQTVIDRARNGRVYNPPGAESRAHIGRARLLERAGDRPGAIESYQQAMQVAGIDARTRSEARAALERLGAS